MVYNIFKMSIKTLYFNSVYQGSNLFLIHVSFSMADKENLMTLFSFSNTLTFFGVVRVMECKNCPYISKRFQTLFSHFQGGLLLSVINFLSSLMYLCSLNSSCVYFLLRELSVSGIRVGVFIFIKKKNLRAHHFRY